jgi:hypothetical protein
VLEDLVSTVIQNRPAALSSAAIESGFRSPPRSRLARQ